MKPCPLRRVALRNLAAHRVRLALTVLSVVLGTAFVAGSFVFTDTLKGTFDAIFANEAQGVDVRVGARHEQALGLDLGQVAKITATPGVGRVAPAVSGPAVLLRNGRAVQTGGAPTVAESYLPPERAVSVSRRLVAGGPPTGPGEIILNRGGARRAGLDVGDRAQVLLPARGTIDVVVRGLYDIPSDTGGFIGVQFAENEARSLLSDREHVDHVDIAATGVSAGALRDRLAEAFPDLKVQTGPEVRAELQSKMEEQLSFVNYFLLAFGAIALLVGTFIIYNTFSMIIAQRLRELALLRAVGASRGQIGRSVVLEALVVGLLGSVAGLAAGLGLAYGRAALLNVVDTGLPTGSMRVLPRTVAVSMLVGLAVTVLSAYAPARRAAKIPPVEAMREDAAPQAEALRTRTLSGAALAGLGAVLVALGARHTGGNAALTVGVGAVGLILAVLLAAPALSRPVLAILGVAVTRPFGPIGRMARTNAARNPRRTAATAFALTLGLMLVSVIAMFGASARETLNVVVDKGIKADYLLSGPQNQFVGVPQDAVDAARAVPGVRGVATLRAVAVKVDDERIAGTSPFGAIGETVNYTLDEGRNTLGPGEMMVSRTEADKRGWHAGDTVELTGLDMRTFTATVSGIYSDTLMFGSLAVSDALYQRIVSDAYRINLVAMIQAEPGADLAALRTALGDAVAKDVVVQVQDREDFKGEQGRQIQTMLTILYGLLALAVVIAILGIVNTLALSVVERRREIGMLRAVGTQRVQVRRIIYLESTLIALFGAAVGVALGLGLGAGFLRTLRDRGLEQIAVPWVQVVAMLLGSAVVGVVAALWPGVRAARTPPLAAIAE
ncbi:MAG: ABC transporter permease [Mycobacteriaceae bacterium]|nr:ABC transporter permease [Mycobacteriaceae bacterium]